MTTPLISILVISYNSSKFIIDTLESIKKQSYSKIELIVSDDFSTDNTIKLVTNWVKQNKSRFINSQIIEATFNSGIPANCNRGLSHVNGEWIMLLAGDDLLLPNCITDLAKSKLLFNNDLIISKLIPFNDFDNSIDLGLKNKYDKNIDYASSLNKQKFKKWMIRFSPFLNAPTFFIKTSTLKEIGGFNEEFNVIEDSPIIFKILEYGNISFFSGENILYRISDTSSTHSKSTNRLLQEDLILLFEKYRKPLLNRFNIIDFLILKQSYFYAKSIHSKSVFYLFFYKAIRKFIHIFFKF